ncbi:hypothetical protein SAMN05216343_11423 [Oscillibacter sp. PC13]|uniref:hypothetical protein n=1 Tax=Oscillibacter sp. PC13 TaxID=1855299 RepID=UPI0008E2D411|nr:hypothetical protein [Oscillibacter sp. PC13]SFP76884.1 hypothetical protein SAMN05216343_11423 [Oscillibacter sp. PC13]
MRKMGYVVLSVLFCLTLAACGRAPAEESPEQPPSTAPEAPAQVPSDTPDTKSPQMSMLTEENAAARAVYTDALKKLLDTNVLPDGTSDSSGYIGSVEDRKRMAENQFAVCDVDKDGREELVLLYTTASMAGMAGFVYDCDTETGTLRNQLTEFPALTFYENGAVKADWSHNQGKAGDFWPYNLYTYDADTDSYQQVGSVDAWDKALVPEDYPSWIDISGSGFVYYLYQDLASQWDTLDPVDEADYLAWLDTYLQDAAEMALPWEDLTAEHIHAMQTPG